MRHFFPVRVLAALIAVTLATGVALTAVWASREFHVRRATFPQATFSPADFAQPVTRTAEDTAAGDGERAPEVNPAAWRQPAAGGQRLESQLGGHRARLSSDARLRGTISVYDPTSGESLTIKDIYVYFVQSGRIAAAARPDESGEFEVGGLAPGFFSLIAAGSDGLVAFNVEILAALESGASVESAPLFLQVAMQDSRAPLAIDSAAVPPTNFNVLLQLIHRHLPRSSAADWLVGPSLDAPDEVAEPLIPEDPAVAGPTVGSTIRKHAVYLRPDGQLRGRVQRLHPRSGQHQRIHGTVIFLMQQDQVFRRSPVDQWGTFSVDDIVPGVYSLAALGTDGFAAFSFQAVPPRSQGDASIRPQSRMRLAANAQGQADNGFELDLALIDPRDIPLLRRILAQHLPGGLGAALAGPGLANRPDPNTGSGGGGGGGGDDSNLWPLLFGLGGAAASNDSNRQASPFRLVD